MTYNFICKFILMFLPLFIATACGDSRLDPAEREASRQRLEQRVIELQQKVADLDKQIADMRVENEQRISRVLGASQGVNNQLNALRNELTGNPSAAPSSPSAVEKPAIPLERSGWDVLLRVIIAAALLAAVFVLIKYFYGRLQDDTEDDDDLGATYRTDLGTVRVSPAAQAMSGSEFTEPPPHSADSPITPPDDTDVPPNTPRNNTPE